MPVTARHPKRNTGWPHTELQERVRTSIAGNMKKRRNIPPKLYKYLRLSVRTLTMLVNDDLYFADPNTWNDPLDTRPSVEPDIDDVELERIARLLFQRRKQSELIDAAKTMGVPKPDDSTYIKRHSCILTDQHIEEINYYASDPDYEAHEYRQFLLNQSIEEDLLKQYEKGIVSLAEAADCPLMWSHYGDEHRGICVGYSVPSDPPAAIYKVEYGGSRTVRASSVAAMLDGSDDARREVDRAVLLQKAENWRYEQEWRLIGRRGPQASLLEMEEVIFGLRCETAAKYIVTKMLEERRRRVKFCEIREQRGRFELRKHACDDLDELLATFPVRHRSSYELFMGLSSGSSDDADQG